MDVSANDNRDDLLSTARVWYLRKLLRDCCRLISVTFDYCDKKCDVACGLWPAIYSNFQYRQPRNARKALESTTLQPSGGDAWGRIYKKSMSKLQGRNAGRNVPSTSTQKT
ncbi:hypothetical protein ACLOJK_001153 [Asimina triloba]